MSTVSEREVKRAVRFLKDLLDEGPLVAQDVYRYGSEEEGLGRKALWAAKEKLGIEITNINNQSPYAHYRCWLWSLPDKRTATSAKNALRRERTENLRARGILPKEALYTTSTTPPKRSKDYWDTLSAWDGKTPPWE